VFLFFVITPPHLLVERAWKRGLEVGRYKAVDDTLAHAVEAYSGMPSLFFTWIRRADKRICFEFLDNTVPLGAPPRTVAFGDNDSMQVLDVSRMLDIERFARIHVDATSPQDLYPDAATLAPERNLAFLQRCTRTFRCVRFAEQASGRVYLELESGRCARIERGALEAPARDEDTRAALALIAGPSLGDAQAFDRVPVLARNTNGSITLGEWGPAAAGRD
jgi:hypothetical protein